MDPETVDGRFLGCSHERFTTTAKQVRHLLDNHPLYHPRPLRKAGESPTQVGAPKGASVKAPKVPAEVVHVPRLYDPARKVEVVVYNMERSAQDCVTAFCDLSRYAKAKVGTAPTPFPEEANDPIDRHWG